MLLEPILDVVASSELVSMRIPLTCFGNFIENLNHAEVKAIAPPVPLGSEGSNLAISQPLIGCK